MSRRKMPKEVEVEILELSDDGLGTAMSEPAAPDAPAKPIHLRNALVGETVRARLLKRRKGKLFGDSVEVLEAPNPDRQRSACNAFPRCGGCVFHHLDYSAQLAHKEAQLRRELDRAGVTPIRFAKPESSGRLGYRRKARLGVRLVGEQVLVGFRESFSNRVARLDACPILTDELSGLLRPLRTLIGALSVRAAVPQIEVAQGEGAPALILRHLEPLTVDDRARLADFARQHALSLLVQPAGPDSVETLEGGAPALLGYTLPEYGLYLEFDPRQFTQVNFAVNRTLVRRALAYLEPLSAKVVVDLFCGIGNFSLALGRAGARVTGLEVDDSAVQRARENARLNGLSQRCDFATRNLYTEGGPPPADAWLIDPPRSGAGECLASWLSSPGAPQEIVYVSCNPVSFADDATTMASFGFELCEVGILDMFPHTSHVETLGFFRRR